MRRISSVLLLGTIVAYGPPCFAEVKEPGWSIMTTTVASACGAPADEIDKAAGFIAEWATRNLDDPAEFTKEKILALIEDDADIRAIIKEKGGMFFIHSCDRWVYMLQLFNEAEGSVMGGKQPIEPQGSSEPIANESGWYNFNGECWFKYEPIDSPIDIVNIEVKEGPPQEMEISLWIVVSDLSVLGAEYNGCRFYEELTGSIVIGADEFSVSKSGSTACDATGDKIGSVNQSLETEIIGAESISSIVEVLTTAANFQFKVEGGPRRNTIFEIPTTGLRDAMKGISICPSSVREVLAQ